jgi:glycosyltransferase involved in cell wall biosynthesis
MAHHIVLHGKIDLAAQDKLAREGRSPRHAMWQLAQRLGACVHAPGDRAQVRAADRLRSNLGGPPEMWALARELLDNTGPGDTIYCNSEASGLPFAALCRGRKDRPRIAMFVHNLDRPRGRAALRWFGAASTLDWFAACSRHQVDFLKRYLRLAEERATFVWDQTDLRFFSPGPASADKRRPVIASVGLEQRDYRTLAAATADLSVDVRISGFSRDAAALRRAFPDVLPDNMSRRFYEWPQLLQLYRDADVVVVSTYPNRYAAGVQGMMEAMACGRPTVVTRTDGLATYLAGNDAVVQVPAGDAVALRRAIIRILDDPENAQRLGQRAVALARERHDSDVHVETLARHIEALRPHPFSAIETPQRGVRRESMSRARERHP